MLGVFLLFAALVFAGQVVAALRTGTTSVPMKILEFEVFERSESPANFWGITGFNAIISAALFCYGIAWLMENF